MRLNEPVTQRAYDFPSDHTLVSVTDLKGRITYCNKSFVAVSGYTEEELLGQPHNLLRHPDMPAEAFRDMWETIQTKGKPWTGLVKNRCKNGDHYWVRANATPVREGSRIVGYLSVRTKPTTAEIQAADQLYAAMRSEAARGQLATRLSEGRVIHTGFLSAFWDRLGFADHGATVLTVLMASCVPLAMLLAGLPIWSAVAASVGASFGLGTWLSKRLHAPLREVIDAANQMAAGDLSNSIAITGHGPAAELQLALAQLNVTVRTIVRDVREEIENVKNGTHEIATGNLDLSARTEAQASNLEQTAASMEEIKGTIQQTAGTASEGAKLAAETSQIASRSHGAVAAVGETMREISASSARIGDIIQVIEGVAFQTNILALNAAVEAARAGDQGRGFAVVASEVRALAQRTTIAAREIRTLIEESRERVHAGEVRATEAQGRMDEAMASVEKVNSLLGAISASSREQSIGAAQVSEAVAQLDTITQQNAAMVEELSAAAASLDAQVVRVSQTIRVFKLAAKDKTLAEEDAVALRRRSKGEAL